MSFFHFTSSERVGVIALIVISIALVFYVSNQVPEPFKDVTNISNKKYYNKNHKHYRSFTKTDKKTKYTFVEFDPNTSLLKDFLAMGLSEKQALVIIRYREKGGKFRTANDFAKVYSISPQVHQQIKPYIKIDTSLFNFKKKKWQNRAKQITKINLNNATEDDLVKLPLIGCSRAQLIIAFREKIAGYYSVNQLNELYGFNKELVDSLQFYFIVDSTQHKIININKASISEMKIHPYFKYFTAKKIVDYRNIKGVINTPSELLKYKILDSSTYQKIEHYISTK